MLMTSSAQDYNAAGAAFLICASSMFQGTSLLLVLLHHQHCRRPVEVHHSWKVDREHIVAVSAAVIVAKPATMLSK